MISLSDLEAAFVYDSFQYRSRCFIGREKELGAIHEQLKGQQLVFLSGIGGIGKTEIALRYAEDHRDSYKTIVFSTFTSSIKNLIIDDENGIRVNSIEQKEDESDEDYYKRKIRKLKEISSPDDLIIIDNFDVELDEDLEKIFELPCKFIITTREDFRDFNYPQINIDKMENQKEILQLFMEYNDIDYSDTEVDVIKKIIDLVDGHTMTVGLIAKYLKMTGDSVKSLYKKFLEKEGIMNTGDMEIKQRKDTKLHNDSVNNHIRVLFSLSEFSVSEKEIISSLSLFENIRIAKAVFVKWCALDDVDNKINKMIKRGWIEYDGSPERPGKISLHQVIQDLVYYDLKPDTGNCQHIAEEMRKLMNTDASDYTTRKTRHRVFDIFIERITGKDLLYANLCLVSGKENKLEEAEKICMESQEKEALDILQKIYREKIKQAADWNGWIESGLDFDEYYKRVFAEVSVMLGKARRFCEEYSDRPEYIAETFIRIAEEINAIIEDWLFMEEEDWLKEFNEIYNQIFDMLEVATHNVLKAEIPIVSKEKLLQRIQYFYLDEGFISTHRGTYFANPEKAYWYQQQIDDLRKEKGVNQNQIYLDDMTNSDFASACAERGEYEKAIELYEKAYHNGEETYDYVLYRMANVSIKAGWAERAVGYLKRILEIDKEEIKESHNYSFYSSNACHELIELLISQECYSDAEHYAHELIAYNEPMLSESCNTEYIKWIISANYQLYRIEKDKQKKEHFWDECVRYYRMIEIGNNISDDISDFIMAYIKRMGSSEEMFNEISEILNHLELDRWPTDEIEKEILEYAISVCNNNGKYVNYHITFLIKYAEFLSGFYHENYSEAYACCRKAQILYDEYELENPYYQNMIDKIMLKCGPDDIEQEQEIRERCNYKLIAEECIKELLDSRGDIIKYCEDSVGIWKEAADAYRYAADSMTDSCRKEKYYEQEISCLKKAFEIIMPNLNQFEYSSYENYWQIADSLARSYINLGNNSKAYSVIEEMYVNTLDYYSKNEDGDNSEWTRKISWLAEYLEDIHCYKEAVDMNFYAIYVVICNEPDISLISKIALQETERRQLYENTGKIIKENISNAVIDIIVELKDTILSLSNRTEINCDYMDLLQFISENYQYNEIEFKR